MEMSQKTICLEKWKKERRMEGMIGAVKGNKD
jgi:hypothetical protein